MKNNCITFLSVFFISLILPFPTSSQGNFEHQRDSLLKVIPSLTGETKLQAYEVLVEQTFMNEPNAEKGFTIFELWEKEAFKQNNIQVIGFAKRASITYLLNFSLYKQIIERAADDLNFLQKNNLSAYYYDVYNSLIYAYFNSGAKDKALEESYNLYTKAKQSKDEEGIQVALYTIGDIYAKTSRWEEAQKYFGKSIDQANKYNLLNPTKMLSYNGLISTTITLKQENNVEDLFSKWENDIKRYEEQQNISTSMLYSLYINKLSFYGEKEDWNKVAEYNSMLENMENIDEKGIVSYYYWKTCVLIQKKEWQKALEYAEKGYTDAVNQGRTQSTLNFVILKAQILAHLNRQDESNDLFGKAFEMKDSLSNQEFHSRLDELRTQYEVDAHIAQKEEARNYMYFAFAGCILLIIALGIWIYYNRQIIKKNKALVKQIKEIQTQQAKDEIERLNKISFDIEDTDDNLCPERRKDQLCIAIRDILHKEKAYRDQTITRDSIVERLGTNKELFIGAFQYCFGMSFSEYVNSLRLKDSITLLEESDLTIEEISERVGFGTVRTFQRQFQTKYNMSPKEYRKAAMK